ncbi:MAG: hypothetical protein AB7J63_03785, partial [Vicinamibacterales bacterium]
MPTADVLARGKWSVSAYRVGLNYRQGFTNVAHVPVTFGVGLTNRIELFGSLRLNTRIDRDLRPLFTDDAEVGGVVGQYPFARQGWSGNKLGDLMLGLKFNLMSEADQRPVAAAIRGMVKLPTGDKDSGASTGKPAGFVDFIVSKEAAQAVEISGYGGAAIRGNADGVSQSGGIRYGIGAGFPSRSPLRVTAEFNGEKPFDDTTTLSQPLIGTDGSVSPLTSALRSHGAATLGFTWQDRKGFFIGAGA